MHGIHHATTSLCMWIQPNHFQLYLPPIVALIKFLIAIEVVVDVKVEHTILNGAKHGCEQLDYWCGWLQPLKSVEEKTEWIFLMGYVEVPGNLADEVERLKVVIFTKKSLNF